MFFWTKSITQHQHRLETQQERTGWSPLLWFVICFCAPTCLVKLKNSADSLPLQGHLNRCWVYCWAAGLHTAHLQYCMCSLFHLPALLAPCNRVARRGRDILVRYCHTSLPDVKLANVTNRRLAIFWDLFYEEHGCNKILKSLLMTNTFIHVSLLAVILLVKPVYSGKAVIPLPPRPKENQEIPLIWMNKVEGWWWCYRGGKGIRA